VARGVRGRGLSRAHLPRPAPQRDSQLVRSGISETVAMQLSGHLTSSTFRRYNITADADLDDAADKLDAAVAQPATKGEKNLAKVPAIGGPDRVEIRGFRQGMVEAPPGFEPGVEVLQSQKTRKPKP
jgi:hypothetical protein